MNASSDAGYIRKFSSRLDSTSELMIPVGEHIQVEVGGEKYYSVFRGLAFLKYLLLDMPRSKDKYLSLNYHNPLQIRFINMGVIYSFKVNLLRTHKNPNLVVTDYPSKIEGYNLRKTKRVRIVTPIAVSKLNNTEKSSGALLDLSATGVRIAIDSSCQLEMADEIDLAVELPGWRSYVEQPDRRKAAKAIYVDGPIAKKPPPGQDEQADITETGLEKEEDRSAVGNYYGQVSDNPSGAGLADVDASPESKDGDSLYQQFHDGHEKKEDVSQPSDEDRISIQGSVKNISPSVNGKLIVGVSFQKLEARSEIEKFYNECCHYRQDENLQKKESGDVLISGHEVSLESKGKKMNAVLRGWKLDESGYLLIERPLNKQMSIDLQVSQDVIARLQKGGSIIGMHTRFGGTLENTNLLVFNFHEDPVEYCMRSDERFDCLIPTRFFKGGNGRLEIGRGMISNISLSGVRLLTNEHLYFPEGEKINISFSLGEFGSIDDQDVLILRLRQFKSCFSYAGSFEELDAYDEEKLQYFFDFCRNWLPE